MLSRLPPSWRNAIKLVGYGKFGNYFTSSGHPSHATEYVNHLPWARLNNTLGHDGVSCSVGYLHNWGTWQPWRVRSLQVEACNVRFALDLYHQSVNPDYFLETSFLQGKPAADVPTKMWKGCVRCTLWIMRSEHNRMFAGSIETVEATWDKFNPIRESVNEVWSNPTLTRFWREGELLENLWTRTEPGTGQTGYGHPYHHPLDPVPFPDLSDTGTGRWFLQHVPLNNRMTATGTAWRDNWARDYSLETEVLVYAVALRLGDEYLLYAHSPKQDRAAVEIQIWGGPTVIVDVPVAGRFWLLDETVAVLEIIE